MSERTSLSLPASLVLILLFAAEVESGLIKNIYQKVTNSGNKTEELVKESSPICGNGIFSTSNQNSVSPEIIFITDRPAQTYAVNGQENGNSNNNDYNNKNQNGNQNNNYGSNQNNHEGSGSYGGHGSNNQGNYNNSTNSGYGNNYNERRREKREPERGYGSESKVANEFRFNAENVTLEELERNGFNPNAPVTFLMHGFTSGYPLQAWMTAIVEAYTIDRESSSSHHNQNTYQGSHNNDYHNNNNNYNNENSYGSGSYHDQGGGSQHLHEQTRRRDEDSSLNSNHGRRVNHNLFIINWNYGARGILYPRAVANIPIVASFVTRFINEKLLGDARVDSRRIQLIGHSLGAHLAGFIGKNTRSKLGRIYGLDPAGPCFGALSGPLYPSSKRLAPTDAEHVITVQTNTALLGIDKPLGRHSVFVEGGSVQPGCKGGGVLKSIGALTWDGGDFDTIACSHSRAPNLLTYRHDQTDGRDDCQLVAYECKDWDSFVAGHCGYCTSGPNSEPSNNYQDFNEQGGSRRQDGPLRPVECIRIGLDWQYPGKVGTSQRPTSSPFINSRPTTSSSWSQNQHDKQNGYHATASYDGFNATRRPSISSLNDGYYSTTGSSYNNPRENDQYGGSASGGGGFAGSNRNPGRRPTQSGGHLNSREKREEANNSTERRSFGNDREKSAEEKSMFLRTGDTQPYCAYHYQVVLELNEPFPKKKPPISLILQDANSRHENGPQGREREKEQNSLTNDEFGNRYDDRTYTHLLKSSRKLKKVDHATLLFRESLPDGHRILKALHINYMSHIDPNVRQQYSSRLCPVKTDADRGRDSSTDKRFYFEDCNSRNGDDDSKNFSNAQDNSNGYSLSSTGRRPQSSSSSFSSSSSSSANQRQTSRRPGSW